MSESDLFLQNTPSPSRSLRAAPGMSTLRQPKQRVLVMGNGSVFDEGTAYRLALNSKLQVIRKKYVDEITFVSDMQFIFPDVFILNEYRPLELEPLSTAIPLVVCSVHLRVVVLRLYSSLIDIYDRTEDQISGAKKFRHQSLDTTKWDELVGLVCRND